MANSQFALFTCQAGAELALKRELTEADARWVPAFARPGVVTMKNTGELLDDSSQLPPMVFPRTKSLSIGRVTGQSLNEIVASLWQLLAESQIPDKRFSLHVWERERQLPGEMDYEPGITLLAEEARAAIITAAPAERLYDDSVARIGGRALDIVIVEPNEWMVGWHKVAQRTDRWPGGMLPIDVSENVISRAYLKLAEAIAWSQLPTARQDIWVELGCAPGGACQYLLENGFRVVGVDPAEVDPWLYEDKNFAHYKMRAADVPRSDFAGARWIAADLNVAPRYTLDAVESIVSSRAVSIRGLVLTLKLTGWHLATPERLKAYAKRVQSWGFKDVRMRQLVHNRQEICLVAMRSRGQRRVRR
jgi:23S rRNA (cytidine2498-2'-O)-methyltransferase